MIGGTTNSSPYTTYDIFRTALIKLFARIGLNSSSQISELHQKALKNLGVSETPELSAQDLQRIYNLSNQKKTLTLRDPSPGFLLDLRDYQKQALSFMMSRETLADQLNGDPDKLSPFWEEV